MKLLAASEGVFAETAGGVTVGTAKKLFAQGRISPDETTVLCITGNGLKTVEALRGQLELPEPIPARLSAFQEHIADEAEAVAV
jgi:threonine synthase